MSYDYCTQDRPKEEIKDLNPVSDMNDECENCDIQQKNSGCSHSQRDRDSESDLQLKSVLELLERFLLAKCGKPIPEIILCQYLMLTNEQNMTTVLNV